MSLHCAMILGLRMIKRSAQRGLWGQGSLSMITQGCRLHENFPRPHLPKFFILSPTLLPSAPPMPIMPALYNDQVFDSTWKDYPIARNDSPPDIEDAERHRHRLRAASSRLFDSCKIRLVILRMQADREMRFRDSSMLAALVDELTNHSVRLLLRWGSGSFKTSIVGITTSPHSAHSSETNIFLVNKQWARATILVSLQACWYFGLRPLNYMQYHTSAVLMESILHYPGGNAENPPIPWCFCFFRRSDPCLWNKDQRWSRQPTGDVRVFSERASYKIKPISLRYLIQPWTRLETSNLTYGQKYVTTYTTWRKTDVTEAILGPYGRWGSISK